VEHSTATLPGESISWSCYIVLLVNLFEQVYSMFATLFVQVFGITKYGKRLGDTANFESFSSSMFTIYQMVTGVRCVCCHFFFQQLVFLLQI
jgi:hypothetical protein